MRPQHWGPKEASMQTQPNLITVRMFCLPAVLPFILLPFPPGAGRLAQVVFYDGTPVT